MANGSVIKSIFFVGILVLLRQNPLVANGSLHEAWTSARQHSEQAIAWCGDNKNVLQLAGCLTHIPGILTIDSEKSIAVEASAMLAMMVTNTKILNELFKSQTGCLAKQCVYNIPKTIAYILASYYDYLRLTGTPKTVPAHSSEARHLRLFKITQFFQLGVEIAFRVFAYMDTLDATPGRRHLSGLLSESADIVELWRLLSRFGVLSEQDALCDECFDGVKQKFSEILNSFSSDLVKRTIDLSSLLPMAGDEGSESDC